MLLEKESVAMIVQARGWMFGDPLLLESGHYVKTVWHFDGNGGGDRRHIVKFIPFDNKTTKADMDRLVTMVMRYRAALDEYEVPTVPIHSLFDHSDHATDDRKFLVEISGYGGPPAEDSIRNGKPTDAFASLHKILEAVKPLFLNQDVRTHLLPVGLNLVPRNFTVDNGEVKYIDFFMPYLYPIHSWPPTDNKLIIKIDHWRHYDARGLLQVLLVHLGRLRPELYLRFDELIAERIAAWQIGVAGWWQERPARHLKRQLDSDSKTRAGKLVLELNIKKLYDLREIGVLMASRQLLPPDELNKLFEDTHCHSNQPPNQERFKFWRDSLATQLRT